MIFIVIIAIILAVLACLLLFRVLKIPKLGSLTLITGGLKTGKSMCGVHLSIRTYYKKLFKYYVYTYVFFPTFRWIPFGPFKRMKKREKPMYYSNVPVVVRNYVPLTLDLIERRKRFRYDSVVYICEGSILADSQLIKDKLLNERLLLFYKLFAHEVRGGALFVDTQSLSDLHYSCKRVISSYLDIHHMIKIPFFCLVWVRELKHSEDGSVVNTYSSDVEDDLKLMFVPKSVWKKYDRYCYSVLTDDLPVVDNVVKYEKFGSKKVSKVISFRRFVSIREEFLDYGEVERKD